MAEEHSLRSMSDDYSDNAAYSEEAKHGPSRRLRLFSMLKHRLRRPGLPRLTMLRKFILLLFIILTVTLVVSLNIKRVRKRKNFDDGVDLPDYTNSKDRRMGMKNLSSKIDFPFEVGCRVPDTNAPRANASFVMLARNSELDDVVKSMESLERHFNQWYNYPWVFLNDVEFTDEFKTTVQSHTTAKCEFGTVAPEKWNFSPDIDPDVFKESIESQGDRKIFYGNMESYHKMCRFYSGEFFKHPLVLRNEWYWRVEPDVQFFCDLTYDPFIEMAKHKKKYGFTVAIGEIYYSVPTLFSTTKAFIKEHEIKVKSAWEFVADRYRAVKGKNAANYKGNDRMTDRQFETKVEKDLNLRRFLAKSGKTDKDLEAVKDFDNIRNIFDEAYDKPSIPLDKFDNEEYNLCHFWSNFEIARTDLFLSEQYQAYYDYLEKDGGFYRERWGDAPVHSIAVAMLLDREELHYFRDIGYKHTTMGHCPNNAPGKQLPYEAAQQKFAHTESNPWLSFMSNNSPDPTARNGVGCRCECPPGHKDVEDYSSMCIKHYSWVMSDQFQETTPFDLDAIEQRIDDNIDRYLKLGGEFAKNSVQNMN